MSRKLCVARTGCGCAVERATVEEPLTHLSQEFRHVALDRFYVGFHQVLIEFSY